MVHSIEIEYKETKLGLLVKSHYKIFNYNLLTQFFWDEKSSYWY